MKRAFLSEGILHCACLLIRGADFLTDFFFKRLGTFSGQETIFDHRLLIDGDGVAQVNGFKLFGRAIHTLVICAGMVGKTLYITPYKGRATSGTCMLNRFLSSCGDGFDIATVYTAPLFFIEHAERNRIGVGRRRADRDAVILDDEDDW